MERLREIQSALLDDASVSYPDHAEVWNDGITNQPRQACVLRAIILCKPPEVVPLTKVHLCRLFAVNWPKHHIS